MSKKEYEMEGDMDTKTIHSREAWNKLHARLRDENLVPEQGVKANSSLVYYGLRIAALALILLVVGAVIYVNTGRKTEVNMVNLNTHNEANTLIKTLADGSVIYIAGNSLFSYPQEFKQGSRNVELKGEAFFDIAPNPARPFIIETEEALVQVLGTAFNVKTSNGRGFELCVDRGTVKVTLKNDPSHSEMVIAGEKISAVDNSLIRSKYNAGIDGSWYKQRMHFKDEKLQDIITVLNRNFNTNFVLADNETGKHKLTVTFQNETAVTMTGLLCAALNLKSQTVNGSVVLSENK
jgi:ferric-dicitrate binding protein FerR (iron transport regulator)